MATETKKTGQVEFLEEGSQSVGKSPQRLLDLQIFFSQQHSASPQNKGENLQCPLNSSLDASSLQGEVGFGGSPNSKLQSGER
jgi:hypothetical protein